MSVAADRGAATLVGATRRKAQDVLGYDHSAVDDDPEVDGPQRQQVRRIPPGAHGRGPRLFDGSYPDCFQLITIW